MHKPDSFTPEMITISGSKSETNRLLLLQALYPEIAIENGSDSDDSAVMQQALQGSNIVIDVHHAGTAMRFLTAYFAIQEGREVILTGSQRMQERPIAVLVNALKSLGADIEYTGQEGYPPLKIKGGKLQGSMVSLDASVSSQYSTALLLIASKLQNGLQLTLTGSITSQPYISMTLSLLQSAGVHCSFQGTTIAVQPALRVNPVRIIVESDWSSASYYYSLIALSSIGSKVTLSYFSKNSLQGDSELVNIYKLFGVDTVFKNGSVILSKTQNPKPETLNLELSNTPDIAQTIAVTCFGLGVACNLTGLHTLKIKETDRLAALQTELQKLGADVTVTNNSLHLHASVRISKGIAVETYNDHRMAMAFAPLAVKVPLIIKDAGVVSKSYPAFWEHFKKLGFLIEPV